MRLQNRPFRAVTIITLGLIGTLTLSCAMVTEGGGVGAAGGGGSSSSGGGAPADCAGPCPDQILQVSAGKLHACAVLADGRVKCWGFNSTGALGVGSSEDVGDSPDDIGSALSAVDLGLGKRAALVTAGSNHNCALLDDGSIKCWGWNAYGQLGLGHTKDIGDLPGQMGDAWPPVDLGTGHTATAVDVGGPITCALLDDGTVKCWGRSVGGALGNGSSSDDLGDNPGEMGDALAPVDLGAGKKATAISVSSGHVCALLDDGSVKCWGSNGVGQLGIGSTETIGDDPGEMGNALLPIDLGTSSGGTSKKATAISAAELQTCAVLDDQSLKCWGDIHQGSFEPDDQEGDDPGEMGDALPAVDLAAPVVAVAPSFNHSCALLQDGLVRCWGYGHEGQLGVGSKEILGDEPSEAGDGLPLVDLGTGQTAVAITVGYDFSCARLAGGAAKCWGANTHGQLCAGHTKTIGDELGEMGDALLALDVE